MWDERYSGAEYAYGKLPNDFLKKNFGAIPKGKILSIAEGEGRNAVFLARQGYEVTAVDASSVGLSKAKRLADEQSVRIECVQADLAEFDPGESIWEGIVSIFCPLPAVVRKELYKKILNALKPGGVLLLEAYTPEQLKFETGGGNQGEVLQTKSSLQAELQGLRFLHLKELEREVIEGRYHTGLGAVVQAIAIKET